MGDRAKFLWFDWWADGTVSASSEAAGYEATNTQDQALSETWRSTGDNEEWVLCDLGENKEVGGVAVIAHNEDSTGKIRVRCSVNSDLSSPDYDSGYAYGWPVLYGAGVEPDGVGSEIVGAGGVPLDAVKPSLPNPVRIFFPSSAVSNRYIEARFRNASNPDGYIEVAHVMAGVAKEITVTLSKGWRTSRPDTVLAVASGSGERRLKSLYQRMLTECVFEFQSSQEAREFWMLITRHAGISRGFVISLLPSATGRNPAWGFFMTYFCRFEQIAEPEWRGRSNFVVPTTLVELVGG